MAGPSVWMYVDEHATMTAQDLADAHGFESATVYEYHEIEEAIQLVFPDATFKREVLFTELSNANPSFYVFDIGGMCVFDHGGHRRLSWLHNVIRQLEDHPSTGFVPWSMMTWQTARTALDDLVLGDSNEIPEGHKTPEFPNLYLPPKAADFSVNFSDAVEWMKKFHG